MTGHLDGFSDAERDALDAVANLHDAMREGAGTGRRFRAHGIGDLMDCARVFVEAMDVVRHDARLLAELGRRQTVSLNVTGPSCVPCSVPEEALFAFYHDRGNLLAAGKLVLDECRVNLAGWLRACREMLDAGDALRH